MKCIHFLFFRGRLIFVTFSFFWGLCIFLTTFYISFLLLAWIQCQTIEEADDEYLQHLIFCPLITPSEEEVFLLFLLFFSFYFFSYTSFISASTVTTSLLSKNSRCSLSLNTSSRLNFLMFLIGEVGNLSWKRHVLKKGQDVKIKAYAHVKYWRQLVGTLAKNNLVGFLLNNLACAYIWLSCVVNGKYGQEHCCLSCGSK